jgi:hypothetical protein
VWRVRPHQVPGAAVGANERSPVLARAQALAALDPAKRGSGLDSGSAQGSNGTYADR